VGDWGQLSLPNSTLSMWDDPASRPKGPTAGSKGGTSGSSARGLCFGRGLQKIGFQADTEMTASRGMGVGATEVKNIGLPLIFSGKIFEADSCKAATCEFMNEKLELTYSCQYKSKIIATLQNVPMLELIIAACRAS